MSRSSSFASSACSCLRWRVGASGSSSVTMATAFVVEGMWGMWVAC